MFSFANIIRELLFQSTDSAVGSHLPLPDSLILRVHCIIRHSLCKLGIGTREQAKGCDDTSVLHLLFICATCSEAKITILINSYFRTTAAYKYATCIIFASNLLWSQKGDASKLIQCRQLILLLSKLTTYSWLRSPITEWQNLTEKGFGF